MELTIKQSKFRFNYQYKVYESSELLYTATINRTIIPFLRQANLYKLDGKKISCLKQESWIKFILGIAPIISFFSFTVCPYIYYENDIKQGYLEEKRNGSSYVFGKISGINFELYQHDSNYIAIYSNNVQVGLIKKSNLKEFDGDQYRVTYNKVIKREVVIILSLLADVLWYTSDTSINSFCYEWTKQLTEIKFDRNWTPED